MALVHRTLAIAAGLLVGLAGTSACAGGVATVSFVHPEKFTDARDNNGRSEGNLKVLSEYLQTLAARYLPDGQTLNVEVTDVDLAGRTQLSRGTMDLRVIRGDIDWPRITLRYTLDDKDQVLQRGEESVADMDFRSGLASRVNFEPLPYEKHMLEDWVKARFVEHRSAKR